jgi:NAD(P)-dependent dehydrogenase (short-subunit alcohol dehydrogenase family)
MAQLAGRTWMEGLKPGMRVVVSAGASGIGRAISDMLIQHGAKLHICDVADSFVADFKNTHPSHGITKADVSKDADVERFFAEAEASLGGVDALINNAGIAGPTGGIDEIAPEDWRRCIDIDLTGQFLCARLAVPLIKAAGGGAIVNMSSAAGKHGYAFRTPYAAAKFGVIGFTQSLAKELGPSNIRVNAILPGIVEGPRIEGVIGAEPSSSESAIRRWRRNTSRRSRCAAWSRRTMSPRWCCFCSRLWARISQDSHSASTATSKHFKGTHPWRRLPSSAAA